MADPFPPAETRERRIGLWVSGVAHAALIGWVAVGGALFRPPQAPALRMAPVETMSAAEFESMAAASRGAGPIGEEASATPAQPRPPSAEVIAGGPVAMTPPNRDADPLALPAPDFAGEAAPNLSDLQVPQSPVRVATVAPMPQQPAPAQDEALPADVSVAVELPPALPRVAAAPPLSSPSAEAPAAALPPPPVLATSEAPFDVAAARERRADRLAAAAEAQRQAAAAAEAQRQAEARRQAEAAAEAARQAEAAAEAQRQAEAAAEAQRQAEAAEAERRAAEEARIAAAAAAREQAARAAAEAAAQEEARRAEAEARAAAEAERQAALEQERREAEEARRAEEERLAAESRRAEEERQAEAARVEAERRAEEERRAEQERLAEARRAEEQREAEEARRRAEEEAAAAEAAEALARAEEEAARERAEAQAREEAEAARLAPDEPDPLMQALNEAMDFPGAGAEGGGGRAAMGPPLSQGEKDGLRLQIEACWNIGSLSREAQRTSVSVQFSMSPDGMPEVDTVRMVDSDGGSDAAAAQAFEAARRAILRCAMQGGGFNLPAEKYGRWRDTIIDFRPQGGPTIR